VLDAVRKSTTQAITDKVLIILVNKFTPLIMGKRYVKTIGITPALFTEASHNKSTGVKS